MVKKYIISSYIPSSPVNKNFFNSLQQCSKHLSAEIRIFRCKPLNQQYDVNPVEDSIKLDLGAYIAQGDSILNSHLKVTSYQKAISCADPIANLTLKVAREGCMILPFPSHRFKTIPRNLTESRTPRAIWCSGTVSEPLIMPNSPYNCHSTVGALLVEVKDDNTFDVKQIVWDGAGFFHLSYYYTPKSYDQVVDAITAISMGDDHALHQDKSIMKQTKAFIKKYKIRHIFRHDTLDCSSISHHMEGKHISKAKMSDLTLEAELKLTAQSFYDFERAFPWATQYAVPSNHPEHLDRYLDEGRYIQDYPNKRLSLELALVKFTGESVYAYAMRKFRPLGKILFPERKDSIKIRGVECNNHGDQGTNGAKGTAKQFGIAYDKVITGHTHSPEITVLGNFVNGTSTKLSLPYTSDSGATSWLNTHTLIYANGTMTHIHLLPEDA